MPFDEVIELGMVGSKGTFGARPGLLILEAEYARMANAIANLSTATGRPPLLYSLCQWGRVSVKCNEVIPN